MKTQGLPMTYDDELGRWVVEGRDAWYSLRCGEMLELHTGQGKLMGRLELGYSWYVIIDGVPLGLGEGRRYIVSIDV